MINFFKKYRIFLTDAEKKFIKSNSQHSEFNNKKETIVFIINYDYYFLLLFKNYIKEKNILNHYNVVGIWSTSVYPNKYKNFILYNLKKFLSILYDLIMYHKCKKIYSSIGFSKFYHYNFSLSNFYKKNEVCKIKINTLKDLSEIKFDDILIGDLIHDSFIKFTSNPTIDFKNPILKKIINKSLNILNFIKKIDSVLNYKILISPYSSYLSFGPLVRYSLKHNKEVYTCGSMFSYFKKLSYDRPLHSENSLNFLNMFEKIDNKKLKISSAKREMDKKFSGEKVVSNQYIAINTYDSKFRKYHDVRLNNVNGVIFLHDFFDAAHDQENLLFNNFFEWADFTFNFINKKKLAIAIKTHPNSINESKKTEAYFKKKYPNLIWLKNNISNLNIFNKQNIKFGVSVNGSVLYELPYFNKVGISCGTNPTSAFKFNLNPNTIKQYKFYLENAQKKEFNKINIQEVYKMYYVYCMMNKDDVDLVCSNINLLYYKSRINYGGSELIRLNNLIDEQIKKK